MALPSRLALIRAIETVSEDEMTQTPEILVEVKDPVATLMFNRPERMNAWSPRHGGCPARLHCSHGVRR
jgi:hypothetical protein